MSKGLLIGLAFCLLALVLGGLFFIGSYHEAYWSSPAVFVPITFLGVLSAVLGGFLIGRVLGAKGRARARVVEPLLFSGGFVVTAAGVLLGVSAFGMALAVSNTGYWGHPPYEYQGDYAIMRLQIDLFRFAVLPELAGGLMLGAALRMKKAE